MCVCVFKVSLGNFMSSKFKVGISKFWYCIHLHQVDPDRLEEDVLLDEAPVVLVEELEEVGGELLR